MSTNHNRIKVADLETNQQNKILITNSSGELEFSDINNIKADSYNGLDYTQEDKALDARQGKVLKDLIDNKVDRVSGERLINASEIAKISTIGNFVSTVKTISSTALLSQNISGFINYINSLTTNLTIGPNETVTYKTSDTGRIFEILLRGRSFGLGQPQIVATDILEITDFLNKDIQLINYPSSRNDGFLSTNKVLSVDSYGNLKLNTINSFPAPYLKKLITDRNLPNTIINIDLEGAYFTPNMTVMIAGQTVNSISYISDNLVKLLVTTGPNEGYFDVTLNNGIQTIKYREFLVALGDVFIPEISDFVNFVEPISIDQARLTTKTAGSIGSTEFSFILNRAKKYRVYFKVKKSPLVIYPNSPAKVFSLIDTINADVYDFVRYYYNPSNQYSILKNGASIINALAWHSNLDDQQFYFEWTLTKMRINYNGLYIYDFTDLFPNTVKPRFHVGYYDIDSIKYVELAS